MGFRDIWLKLAGLGDCLNMGPKREEPKIVPKFLAQEAYPKVTEWRTYQKKKKHWVGKREILGK